MVAGFGTDLTQCVMVPNDLARRAASEDVHIDLLGS